MAPIVPQPPNRPAYGWDEDRDTWELLRADPPRSALQWVEREVGGKVRSLVALRGGLSSAVHRVDVQLGRGASDETASFVLRRQVRHNVLDEEPDVVAREAAALQIAVGSAVPTPRLVAYDELGTMSGEPSLLMTYLAGRTMWNPEGFDEWLIQLAELLPAVHSVPQLPGTALHSFVPFFPAQPQPPPTSRRPQLWSKALDVAASYKQLGDAQLIHRDFHPGNVLWLGGSDSPDAEYAVSGLVDWMSACWGPGSMDVSHCRMNLIESHNLETADKFTKAWELVSGESFDPTADVITAVDWLEGFQESPTEIPEVEENLARALARLA